MPSHAASSVQQTFSLLAVAHTDVCRDLGNKAAMESYMNSLLKNSMLQGSCCNPMDLGKYTTQVTGLQQYADVSQIPKDPYNLTVATAEEMLGWYDHINLTATQQGIYEQAASKTADNGWCCCQCWAWYTHAGLAKYLITHNNFTATQVTAVTNLEDCCGGA